MSMTLARVEDREGGDTSDKLSMFYLETRDDQGQLNNIQVKQKTLNDVQVFFVGLPLRALDDSCF